MAELKTKPTSDSVERFLDALDEARRHDCQTLVRLMSKATGAAPRMWGANIVGFGDYHYKYETGREGDWFQVGFSPRARDLTLYLLPNLDRHQALLDKLGPHKTGKSCLYVKRLSDVDGKVLEKLIAAAVTQTSSDR